MTQIDVNGMKYETLPLTVLANAKIQALARRLIEHLTTSQDETEKLLAAEYGGYIYVYSKLCILIPEFAPQKKNDTTAHVQNFIVWIDQYPGDIQAMNGLIDDASAPPGDKRHAPPEALTEDEKKAS